MIKLEKLDKEKQYDFTVVLFSKNSKVEEVKIVSKTVEQLCLFIAELTLIPNNENIIKVFHELKIDKDINNENLGYLSDYLIGKQVII
jgi:vacuolar-type H+-ATPase catalytic subunit A/Vma1